MMMNKWQGDSMKTYEIYESGSKRVGTINATTITKAAKQFISTLEKKAKYNLHSREVCSIRYSDNRSVMSNFIVQRMV